MNGYFSDFTKERREELRRVSRSFLADGEAFICSDSAQKIFDALQEVTNEVAAAKEVPDVTFSVEEDTLSSLREKLASVGTYLQNQAAIRAKMRAADKVIIDQMREIEGKTGDIYEAYVTWLEKTLEDYRKMVEENYPKMDMAEENPRELEADHFNLEVIDDRFVDPLIEADGIEALQAKWSELSKPVFPLSEEESPMMNSEFWERWKVQIQAARILSKEVFDVLKSVSDELSRCVSERLVDSSHVASVDGILGSLQEYIFVRIARPITEARRFLQDAMPRGNNPFREILKATDAGFCEIVCRQRPQVPLCDSIGEDVRHRHDQQVIEEKFDSWRWGMWTCFTLPCEGALHALRCLSCYYCCWDCCTACSWCDQFNGNPPLVLGRDRFSNIESSGACLNPPLSATRWIGDMWRLCCCDTDPCAKMQEADVHVRELKGELRRVEELQKGLAGPAYAALPRP